MEILSNGDPKDTPIVTVENITTYDYEQPVIPFNVTDSNGNLISGEVIVTVFGEEDISKYTIVYNGAGLDSLKKIDIDSISKYNNNLDLSDVYNIIYSSMNKTNFNPTLLMDGITDICDGISINVSQLITNLIDYGIIDVSQIGDKLKNLTNTLNTTNLYFIYYLSDAVYLNKTTFMNGLDTTLSGFNMTTNNIKYLLEDIRDYLNLTFSSEIEYEINNVFNGTEILKLQDVFSLIKDVYIYNNLTMPKVVNALDNVTGGSIFDISGIILNIFNPDLNSTIIKDGLSKMINSFTMNITKALDIYNKIKDQFDFNITEIIGELSYITEIDSTKLFNIFDGIMDIYNGITFNETYVAGWVKDISEGNYSNIVNKILNITQFNTSSIKEGFDKLIPEINFKLSTLFLVGSILSIYGEFNSSMILGGLDKIIMGFGANVSEVISKLFNKIGYYVTFPYGLLKPGTYNFTVKYMENDYFNSAINTAKLNVVPSQNYIINVYMSYTPEKYGDETSIAVFLMDGYENEISGVLNVTLNDEKIGTVETDEYGYAQYIIHNLTNGRYYIEFEYNGAYSGINFDVTVPDTATNIIYSDMKIITVNTNVDGKIGKYFKVVLKDEDGKALANKQILIGHNGKTYKRTTDKNGAAKFQLNILKSGIYTVAACYLGDDIYGASYITAKITVNKQTPKLTAKKQTYKVKAKKKTLKATFKSAKGHAIKNKVIKFTVKGKTYSAKTNSKGIASVNVKLAKKGTYKVTVKFAGDTTYKAVSKKITLRIR